MPSHRCQHHVHKTNSWCRFFLHRRGVIFREYPYRHVFPWLYIPGTKIACANFREHLLPQDGNIEKHQSREVRWGFEGGDFNPFGFYLSDANDQGASLRLNFKEGGSLVQYLDFAGSGNGNLAYISLVSESVFDSASLIFDNQSDTVNDGWGIDNVTLAKVPEPGTLALLGLGLVGLSMARRRQS